MPQAHGPRLRCVNHPEEPEWSDLPATRPQGGGGPASALPGPRRTLVAVTDITDQFTVEPLLIPPAGRGAGNGAALANKVY